MGLYVHCDIGVTTSDCFQNAEDDNVNRVLVEIPENNRPK